jgi:hypothetical protein
MSQIHFEVFARRKSGASWSLEQATEDRARALGAAEELLADGRAVAVRVTKETLDEETREFKSVTILSKGETELPAKAKKAVAEEHAPLCVSPQDLYTGHARERIGRLLGPWLSRYRATPFELMHRPDLIEQLDASGMDLQHAIQKIAIPEAQETGVSVHEVIRSFQRLAQAAIERVLKDERKGVLPKVDLDSFAQTVERLAGEPERHYLLGAAVADFISAAPSWSGKIGRLLDLADAAPISPKPRALALQVIEQPLAEALGTSAAVSELLGDDLDLGGLLAAMTRLAAAEAVEALAAIEPAVATVMPPLEGPAARLANWLDGPHFVAVRVAVARRVLKELTGPRRLRPDDAAGEITVLRALAMALTSASDRLLTLHDVQNAVVERSKLLVRSDFVQSYIGEGRSPQNEIEALLWLAENVAGGANKREAARWALHALGALRFETDLRAAPGSPAAKLAAMRELQRAVERGGFVAEDARAINARIGEIGGLIEQDARLCLALARADAPVVHRLTLLLKLAAAEASPTGPVADRAKQEAIKLLRGPETRAELSKAPEAVGQVRALLKTVGLAA